jgi:hypothetical protein
LADFKKKSSPHPWNFLYNDGSYRRNSLTNMAAAGNSFFLIGQFLKIFFSETALQKNRILVGSIYEKSSIKVAHFVPICLQTWPSQAILVSDWSISKNFPL